MKGILSLLIVLALFSGTAAFAENHAKPMTDDDVIAMVKAGLPDDTIISAINGQQTDFDVSAMALVNLKNQGVGVKVIDAMLAASKKQHDATSNSTAAPPAGSAPSAAPPPQGEQFVSSGTPSQPSGNNPQGGAPNSAAPASNGPASSGQPAQHTSFFDKLNQTQNQITGTINQGQSNYQQVRGGMPGHQQTNAVGQATGAYPGAPATNSQPAMTSQPAAPGAYPPATNAPAANQGAANQAAAQARYQQQLRQQQQQRDAAARQAAMQQQRQQQAAANQQRQQLAPAQRQQRAARVSACMQQATKAHPQGGPDLAKAYQACNQAP